MSQIERTLEVAVCLAIGEFFEENLHVANGSVCLIYRDSTFAALFLEQECANTTTTENHVSISRQGRSE
jgi:hypothetical protein